VGLDQINWGITTG